MNRATPDGHLSVLDPRFPIALTGSPGTDSSEFWELRNLRPDRACIDSLVIRARADAAAGQERFIQPLPRFVPALAHEDTSVDGLGLPAGWYRDSPPREGAPQPEDTDTFIAVVAQAEAEEAEVAKRRPAARARRAIVRAARAVRQQPPAAGEL